MSDDMYVDYRQFKAAASFFITVHISPRRSFFHASLYFSGDMLLDPNPSTHAYNLPAIPYEEHRPM
jgi:hypothetical protein